MAVPPPSPAAGTAPPPPIFNFVAVDLHNGNYTTQAISQLTEFWSFVVGEFGLYDQVQIIQNMHGDGTLSPTGVLIVTKTNGVPFGYFATGTDAANLSGILNPARIAANSLPYNKLLNAPGPILLGASGAGPITSQAIGPGLDLSGGVLSAKGPVYTFAALPAPAAGLRAFVSDSSVAAAGNFGAAVAGGGANFVPVWADGAAFNIG